MNPVAPYSAYPRPVLGDYGLADELTSTEVAMEDRGTGAAGTPGYMAPVSKDFSQTATLLTLLITRTLFRKLNMKNTGYRVRKRLMFSPSVWSYGTSCILRWIKLWSKKEGTICSLSIRASWVLRQLYPWAAISRTNRVTRMAWLILLHAVSECDLANVPTPESFGVPLSGKWETWRD